MNGFKRRLVKHGESTLMISLPSDWLKNQNLGKGSEIDLVEMDGKLIIGGEGKRKERTEEIFLDHNTTSEDALRTILAAYYTAGVDVLKIKFTEVSTLLQIQKVVNMLIGYEIVEQSENYCVVKNLAMPAELDLTNHLKKMFYLLKMQNDMISEYMIKGKKVNAQESAEYRQTVFKTRDLLCRQLANTKSVEKACFYYTILQLVARISTESINLLKYVKSKDSTEITAEVKKYFIRTNDLLDTFARHLFSKNFKDNVILMRQKEALKEQFYRLIKDKKNDAVILHHCVEIAKKVSDMNSQYLAILF